MALTKANLSEALFNKVGLNKSEAKEMVEAFFEEIKVSLEMEIVSSSLVLETLS